MGFFNQLKEQAFEKAKEEMMQNLGVPPEIIESLTGAVGGGGGGANKKSGRMSQEEYEATKPAEMRKDIRMISGCEDSQTSADVSNVASFQLPDPAGALYSNCALDCIIACSLEWNSDLSIWLCFRAYFVLRTYAGKAGGACTSTLLNFLYADEKVPEDDLRWEKCIRMIILIAWLKYE